VPITLPAHSSMLTGQIPPIHGVRTNAANLADNIVTLPERLKTEGYATGAIVSAFVLDRRFGLCQGFDTYEDRFREGGAWIRGTERLGGETSKAAIEWLRRHKDDEKFFLFLHYFDPHDPYQAPEPFASRFPDEPYAAEVTYADHCVGQVLDELRRLELFDDTLVILTSDHGEMLGEHGELTHLFFVYESAIKVPLIVKLPGQDEAQRVEDVVGLVDITPTICSLLGLLRDNMDGIDLSAYLRGTGASPEAQSRYLWSESVLPEAYGANPLAAQVGRRWKYIRSTRPELYDLLEDPEESSNLVEAHPRRARLLETRAKNILARAASARAEGDRLVLDEEARRRLESLGYVDVTERDTIEFDATREDAKDLIHVHLAFQAATRLRWAGRDEEALGEFRKIIEERPDLRDAQVMVAHLLRRLGRHEESLEHSTIAIGLDPRDPREYAQRGLTHEALGDDESALADYTAVLERSPVDPRVYLLRARVLARRGEVAAAIGDLEDAKRAFPPGSEAWAAAEELRIRLTSGGARPEPPQPPGTP